MPQPVDTFTVEIPKQIAKQIAKRGYDVKSWIVSQLYELLNDVRKEKIDDLVKNKTKEIDDLVSDVKNSIKVT